MNYILMSCCLRNVKATLIALPLSLVFTGTFASEAGGEGSEHSYEHYGKHALGPFIGITREDGLNRETIGFEYSYRINKRWSVGGLIKRAERDKSSTLGMVFAHFWPTEFL